MKHVFEIARQVREELEAHIKASEPDTSDLDTCGYCAIASAELYERLIQHGVKADFVCGEYERCGHCWVVVKGTIIDVTADQFSNQYPKVFVTPTRNTAYHPSLYNQYGLNRVNKFWPVSQRPGWVKF